MEKGEIPIELVRTGKRIGLYVNYNENLSQTVQCVCVCYKFNVT